MDDLIYPAGTTVQLRYSSRNTGQDLPPLTVGTQDISCDIRASDLKQRARNAWVEVANRKLRSDDEDHWHPAEIDVQVQYVTGHGPLDLLPAAAQAADDADAALTEAVRAAKAAGHSWDQIGRTLGITRQGAQQRFGSAL